MTNVVQEEANEAWQATLEGRYDEALASWDRIIHRDPDYRDIENRGVVRLVIGDLDGALEDFRMARTRVPSVPAPKVGVALWLAGLYEEACTDWEQELVRQHTGEVTHFDETGAIAPLLWWASWHDGLSRWRDASLQDLKRRWQSERTRHSLWPGSIVGLIVGEVSSEAVGSAAQSQYPLVQARRACRAHFYIAARRLLAGDQSGYRSELAQVVADRRAISDSEYHLARGELYPR